MPTSLRALAALAPSSRPSARVVARGHDDRPRRLAGGPLGELGRCRGRAVAGVGSGVGGRRLAVGRRRRGRRRASGSASPAAEPRVAVGGGTPAAVAVAGASAPSRPAAGRRRARRARARAPTAAAPARRRRWRPARATAASARSASRPRPAVQAPLLIGGQRRAAARARRSPRSGAGACATSLMRSGSVGRGSSAGPARYSALRRSGGAVVGASAARAAGRPFPAPSDGRRSASTRSAARPLGVAAFSASARRRPPASAARLLARLRAAASVQVRAAVRAEARVAAVQLAAAGQVPPMPGSRITVSPRGVPSAASSPRSSSSIAASRADLVLDELRRRPAPRRAGLVDEAAEVAQQRARGRGAGSARGAAAGCGGRSRRGARGPRARCRRAGAARPRGRRRELRGRIRGPARSCGRLRPGLLGGARASDASKEAAHACRETRRGAPSERV